MFACEMTTRLRLSTRISWRFAPTMSPITSSTRYVPFCAPFAAFYLTTNLAFSLTVQVTRPAHVQIADVIMYATNQSGPRDLARVGASLGAPEKK